MKRAYEPAAPSDGRRYLVERLWPRGVRKEALALTEWLKDLAPSSGLRQWYAHDVSKFGEFAIRYREELDGHPALIERLLRESRRGPVTLVYASADSEHSSATILRQYLERKEAA